MDDEAQVASGSDAETDGEKEDKDNEDEDEDDDDDDTEKGDLIDLFVECVILKDQLDHIGNGGWRFRISDYRFWLTTYVDKKKIDLNVIGRKIHEEAVVAASKVAKEKRNRAKISKSGEQTAMYRSFEKWKLLSKKRLLAEAMDAYVGCNHASPKIGAIEATKLNDPTNPVCITQFFNPSWAFRLTDPNAEPLQSEWNFKEYVDPSLDGTMTLRFPLRQFVYRIPLSDITSESLHDKIMPDQQQRTVTQFIKMLPLMLKDPQLYEPESIGEEKSDFLKDVNPLQQDAGRTRRGKENEGDGTSLDRPTSSGITREENRKSMFQMFGVIGYDEKAKHADNGELIMSTQLKLADFFMEIPGAMAMYATCYSPIAVASKKNIEKIRFDISNGMNKVGYWGKLKNHTLIARKLYLLNQDKVFREYTDTCRSPDANLSAPGKAIMANLIAEGLYSDKREPHTKVDARYTNFVNMEIRRYDEWEQVYLVNHAHLYMNLAFKYSFDAYCMNFTRVHQNMVTHGKNGNESKSYLWKVLTDHIRIQKTAEVLMYQSLKSNAVDDVNNNDAIIVFDEMEQRIFDSQAKGENDKERMLKQQLATNKVSAKILQITDDGKRISKITYSECITVYFGSTNHDLACMSPAMRRRWHIAHFDERFGLNRAIIELELAGLILNETEKASRKKLDREHHLIQTMIFEVEKLIYCRGLTDVSMHVAMVILLYISNEMHQSGRPEPNSSMFQRILVLARINCILDALENTFFAKGAKYAGKRITVQSFKELDRKLYCCAQHVVSALGETLELLIDPAEPIIRRGLKYIHEFAELETNYQRFRRCGKRKPTQPLFDDTTDPQQQQQQQQYVGSGQNTNEMFQNIATMGGNIERRRRILQGVSNKQTKENYVDGPDNIDYNYVCFYKKPSIEALATRLLNTFPILEPKPDFKPSSDVIKEVIRAWKNRQIKSKNFVGVQHADGYMIAREDPNSQETIKPICLETDLYIFVHCKFLNTEEKSSSDYVSNIIKDIFSKKCQLEQYFCFNPDTNHPHIRNILHVTGETEQSTGYITVPSVIQIKAIERSILSGIGNYNDMYRQYKRFTIDSDLDTWGLKERNKVLYIETKKIDPKCLENNPLDINNKGIKHIDDQLREIQAEQEEDMFNLKDKRTKIDNNKTDIWEEYQAYANEVEKEEKEDEDGNEDEEKKKNQSSDLLSMPMPTHSDVKDQSTIYTNEDDIATPIRTTTTTTTTTTSTAQSDGINKRNTSQDYDGVFSSDQEEEETVENKEKIPTTTIINNNDDDIDLLDASTGAKNQHTRLKKVSEKTKIVSSDDEEDDSDDSEEEDDDDGECRVGTLDDIENEEENTINIADEEERADMEANGDHHDTTLDDDNGNDSNNKKKNNEDHTKYDESRGYFVGEPIDSMFSDDIQSIENLTREDIDKLYNSFDVYDPATIEVDYDFDPEDYIVTCDKETGKKKYHWDFLKETEWKRVLEQEKRMSNWTFLSKEDEDLLTEDEREERLTQLFEIMKKAHKKCSWKTITNAILPENATDDEVEKLKREADEYNMSKYKLFCVHPKIIDNLANLKYYDDPNVTREDGEKLLFKYPDDMISQASETRASRWNEAKKSFSSEEELLEALREEYGNENAEKVNLFLTLEYNNGKIYRNPENDYCLIQNSFQRILTGPTTREYYDMQLYGDDINSQHSLPPSSPPNQVALHGGNESDGSTSSTQTSRKRQRFSDDDDYEHNDNESSPFNSVFAQASRTGYDDEDDDDDDTTRRSHLPGALRTDNNTKKKKTNESLSFIITTAEEASDASSGEDEDEDDEEEDDEMNDLIDDGDEEEIMDTSSDSSSDNDSSAGTQNKSSQQLPATTTSSKIIFDGYLGDGNDIL